jgi:hypothetical protein
VEADYRLAAFLWCADLGRVGKLPLGPLGWWTINKHRFHRVMRRTTPIELDRTNRSNLPIGKIGILGFEVHDQLTHGDRKRAVMIYSLRFGWSEETNDAMCVKGIRSTTQAPFCQTCFLCAFCWRDAEKHNRANPFIQALFWGSTPLLEQMIVVRSLPSFSLGLWHRYNSRECAAKETKRGASFACSILLSVWYETNLMTTRICSEHRMIFPLPEHLEPISHRDCRDM